MGNNSSKTKIQEEFTVVSPLFNNPSKLKHNKTGERCELVHLSITPQDRKLFS